MYFFGLLFSSGAERRPNDLTVAWYDQGQITLSLIFYATTKMDIIYHEKQQGSFCAQHCLNNLLQGEYFNAGDLADIAHQLDVQERAALGQTPSETSCLNNDETGFFSVQVHPVPQDYHTIGHSTFASPNASEDAELTAALNVSMQEADATEPSLQQLLQKSDNSSDDEDLARAIALSLQANPPSFGTPSSTCATSDHTVDPQPGSSIVKNNASEPSAMADQPDPEELRRKRTNYYAHH
nr:unnamed protein product [Spirometra erinaceieuropaei]